MHRAVSGYGNATAAKADASPYAPPTAAYPPYTATAARHEAGRDTHQRAAQSQLASSGLPSAYPAALWMPTTARSANSSRVAAPA